jgi:putative N6-adenine-specific DNA methylase
LELKLSQLPWELFLKPDQEIDFRVSAKKSKLYHSDAIADRFRSSISGRISIPQQQEHGRNQRPDPQHIFVRVINDRFTVSLDSSGVNLHKRGIKTIRAKAPLRETTAAAVLMLAGYSPPEPLIDPMCGSGTFSVEAALMAGNVPAGWFRDFAFTGWPAYRQAEKRWKHLKREAEKGISIAKQPLVLASDIDPQACHAFQKTIRRHRFGAAIDISPGDFFDLCPPKFLPGRGLVVINPPYGRRIDTPEGPRSLLLRIGKKLIDDFQGWKYALIVPAKSMLQQFPLSAKVVPVFHGGLQVLAAIGKVPTTTHNRSPQAT